MDKIKNRTQLEKIHWKKRSDVDDFLRIFFPQSETSITSLPIQLHVYKPLYVPMIEFTCARINNWFRNLSGQLKTEVEKMKSKFRLFRRISSFKKISQFFCPKIIMDKWYARNNPHQLSRFLNTSCLFLVKSVFVILARTLFKGLHYLHRFSIFLHPFIITTHTASLFDSLPS